jgi:phosphate transport system permease protein
MNPIYASRRRNDMIIRGLCMGAALFGVTWLALILFTLFYNGIAGISLQIFTQNTPPPGSMEGGLLNAIVGSIVLTFLGIVVATPLGVFAGTYLAEYGKNEARHLIRFINDILLSAPSILIGLFVYVVGGRADPRLFRLGRRRRARHHRDPGHRAHHRGHAAAGAASAARGRLGARRAASGRDHLDHLAGRPSGMVTGILLALARIAGETAPLLFTALNNNFWFSPDLTGGVANLPVTIYQFASAPTRTGSSSPGPVR